MKKLLRGLLPDPRQLALQLDFLSTFVEGGSVRQPLNRTETAQAEGMPSTAPSTEPSKPTAPSAPPLAQKPGQRRLQLRDHLLEFTLTRSRRRSIGFVVDDEGLRVTAPRWVTIAEIEGAIREKERWIVTKLAQRRERQARLPAPMEWRDGARFPYLGRELMLCIRAGDEGVRLEDTGERLLISLPSDAGERQVKDAVLGWLQRMARETFAERLPIYAEKMGVQFTSFALSSANTQWGSCTHDGRIRLNWRLMHFALPQIDYVIAHELAHLREMNHGPRFWATVQAAFPEFESARRILRDQAPQTLPAF